MKRIIDDSIEAEAEGLQGVGYFDAQYKYPGVREVQGYAFYDRSIHRAAEVVMKNSELPVVLDDGGELFQPGQSPGAALYCGWYSHGLYIDAFTWEKGAIGYHIASSECSTLRKKNSTVWCKRMLEDGAAATIGSVREPFVESFPPPELFFTLLTAGRLTLAESYLMSTPYLSWQMVLVGDPLYRPFKVRAESGENEQH